MRLRSVAKPIAKVSESAPWRPLPKMHAVKTPLNAPESTLARTELSALSLTQDKYVSWRRIERIDNLWEVNLW